MNYDDIINLPHHVSTRHPKMSMWNRAAQFAPFAALTGHDEAIQETARLTDSQILDESSTNVLNRKMAFIRTKIAEQPHITITYFLPDTHKEGGAYQTASGNLKKIDDYNQTIILSDGTTIPISAIFELEGEFFSFI